MSATKDDEDSYFDNPLRLELAKVIWDASRKDEGTISGIGAEHVADAVLKYLNAGAEAVEQAAQAMRRAIGDAMDDLLAAVRAGEAECLAEHDPEGAGHGTVQCHLPVGHSGEHLSRTEGHRWPAGAGAEVEVDREALTDAALVDLYWRTSGDDWAIPDRLMVKFGRAVLAAGGAAAPTVTAEQVQVARRQVSDRFGWQASKGWTRMFLASLGIEVTP